MAPLPLAGEGGTHRASDGRMRVLRPSSFVSSHESRALLTRFERQLGGSAIGAAASVGLGERHVVVVGSGAPGIAKNIRVDPAAAVGDCRSDPGFERRAVMYRAVIGRGLKPGRITERAGWNSP